MLFFRIRAEKRIHQFYINILKTMSFTSIQRNQCSLQQGRICGIKNLFLLFSSKQFERQFNIFFAQSRKIIQNDVLHILTVRYAFNQFGFGRSNKNCIATNENKLSVARQLWIIQHFSILIFREIAKQKWYLQEHRSHWISENERQRILKEFDCSWTQCEIVSNVFGVLVFLFRDWSVMLTL